MTAASDGAALTALHFGSTPGTAKRTDGTTRTLFATLATQLDEYFARQRRVFDVPLAPHGTPFQHLVWHAVGAIGWGETCSYGVLAARIGRPTSARAVAAALGRNPIAIIVPCHRVVGADGHLRGYAAGLDRKAALLATESTPVPAQTG